MPFQPNMVALTDAQFEIFRLLAQDYHHRKRQLPGATVTSADNNQWVELTSTTATGGMYRGNWFSRNPLTGIWSIQNAVWVVFANGSTPQLKTLYRGLQNGAYSDGLAIFVVDDACCVQATGSVPSLCQCVDPSALIWYISGSDIVCSGNHVVSTECLPYVGSCCWGSFSIVSNIPPCTPTSFVQWSLCYSGGAWSLTGSVTHVDAACVVTILGTATYSFSGVFNCAGSNTFSLHSSTGCTWPATVTADSSTMNCGGGGSNILTQCCPLGLPQTLHATITNVSGCACLAGTYALVWNGSSWHYSGSVCGHLIVIDFACTSSTDPACMGFSLDGLCDGLSSFAAESPDSCDCPTPSFVFNRSSLGLTVDCFCSGLINVAIGA